LILVKKLTDTALLPTRAHPNDAGLDLYADEQVTIDPGDHRMISTGISLALDHWRVGLVCPRSGLALHEGVTVLNAPGVVDSGYRGAIGVILINHGRRPFTVEPKMRIAQLLIQDAVSADTLLEVVNLPPAERDTGGFGSTGQ
jgi:dUTP pyrophosphatase